MRLVTTTVAMALASTAVAGAQQPPADQGGSSVQIEDLRTPTSPAFVLLDVAPVSVERPENPKALIVNLVSTAAQSEGFRRTMRWKSLPIGSGHIPT